jgi:hypothetical protein
MDTKTESFIEKRENAMSLTDMQFVLLTITSTDAFLFFLSIIKNNK